MVLDPLHATMRFHQLCRFFIDGYNPPLTEDSKPPMVIVLDCILSLPTHLIPNEACGRYFAYNFCRAVTAVLTGAKAHVWLHCSPDDPVAVWLAEWAAENAPAPRSGD